MLALAGCSPAEDTTGAGTGAGAMSGAGAGATSGAGAVGGMTGGSAGTNPAAGAGAMGGTTGGTMVGGMSGGMTGGSAGTTGGSGGEPPDLTCESDMDIRTDATCEDAAEGVFAIKTVIDVWWKDDVDPPLVDPGRGTITIYLKGELSNVCPDGSNALGVIKGCGTELPHFKSDANCDAFQIQFPDALWDQPDMPTFTTTGNTTGFNPNDLLSVNIATGLVGVELAEPEAVWPTSADNIVCPAGMASGNVEDCFPDHDGDGHPGVTIKMGRIGEQLSPMGCGIGGPLPFIFRGAPLDALGALVDEGIKAETLYVGVRTRIGGAGAINADCASGVGDSTAEFVDSRVIGCTKQAPVGQPMAGVEMDCTLTDAQFVDSSAPNYNIIAKDGAPPMTVLKPATQGGGPLDQTPSVGPRSALVRLGDLDESFDCAAVRGAAFPEL